MRREKRTVSLVSEQRSHARRWLVAFLAVAVVIAAAKGCAIKTGHSNPVDRAITTIASPAVYVVRRCGEGLGSLVHIFSIPSLLRENNRLLAENAYLNRQVTELKALRAENERLRELSRLRTPGYRSVLCNVIARPYDLWCESVLVDAGRDQGVRVGNIAVNSQGVAGKVAEVEPDRSRVQLITSPQFRLGAVSESTREEGVIRGVDWRTLVLDYIPAGSKIALDEKVFTLGEETYAGGDNNRPRGVYIGTIVSRKVDKNGFLEVIVEPAVNPNRLGTLAVLTR